jgi:hypothetical protein
MGVEDLAAGLSTRMGGLLLTDKEALGLVIKGLSQDLSHDRVGQQLVKYAL